MQLDSKHFEAKKPDRRTFLYSNGIPSPRDRTDSTSHGGFDNDVATLHQGELEVPRS